MNKGFEYKESLEYTAPSHGGWGLVRVFALVPEIRILFICPSACGRHSALGAIQQGIKEKVSYYYIDKNEIAEGYDKEIKEACYELLDTLQETPKAFIIVVSCLDDLIGTDVDKISAELQNEKPDIVFRAGHMNPITLNTDHPPIITNYRTIFDFIEKPKPKDNGINILGPFVNIRKKSELFFFLETLGYGPIRHLGDCKSFEEFEEMGKSSKTLLLSPMAIGGAKVLKEKFDIDFMPVYVSYDLDEINSNYESIYRLLVPNSTIPKPDLSVFREKAINKIKQVKEVVGHRPVYISQGAVLRPFCLGYLLSKFGFNVKAIISQDIPPFEKKYMEYIRDNTDAVFIQTQHFKTILFENISKNAVCIGYDAAYIAQSEYVVTILNDEKCFGYDGIYLMMTLLEDAAINPRDLKTLIKKEGLIL